MTYLQFFPEAFIQLNQEIQNFHPALHAKMHKLADKDSELQFVKMVAQAAAHVNVALDGTYDEPALIKVADIVLERLQKRRPNSLEIPRGFTLPAADWSKFLPNSFHKKET